jgi:hypothetical protein
MSDKRLIDANALRQKIEKWAASADNSISFTDSVESFAYDEVLDAIDAAPTIDPEALRPTWRDPDKDPPKVEEDVLILFETACGGYGITTAHYEDGTVLSEKSAFYWEEIFEWGTYDEESDDYFIPKGWWEYRYFNPDDVYNNRVDSPVVGWMPLPPKEVFGIERPPQSWCYVEDGR